MRRAVILHGTCSKKEYYMDSTPSLSNMHWLPWLQKQLLINDIFAVTPEITRAYKLDYEVWKNEIERFNIDENTDLVGHSCGGGFWVRYLSENTELKVGNVVLVAPWLDPENSKPGNFFDFKLDPKIANRTKQLVVFASDNDAPSIVKTVATLREQVKNLVYKEFPGYKHFTSGSMKTNEFPELLEELTNRLK